MPDPVPLLIVGAGPYGLAMSAYARRHGIAHVIAGRPMDFWASQMPRPLYLRSGCDWHLDPFDEDTIEAYLEAKNLTPAAAVPLSRDVYLDYCDWFQRRKDIRVTPKFVRELNASGGPAPCFQAVFDGGETLAARSVVVALGFGYFPHVPDAYASLFPARRLRHACEVVDFSGLRGRRVLIIGGRQSAFEWAACIREQGAEAVFLSYRHPTPAFVPSDSSWVNPLVDAIAANPGWYQRIALEEKEQVARRLWTEGRLKLEPWLAPRIAGETVRLFPGSQVVGCRELPCGALDVQLDTGAALRVDQVILATGYKVDIARVPFLARGTLLRRLETRDGFPVLDAYFESSVPGLYFTSLCATQDGGPFFAFTVGARASAVVIGSAVRNIATRAGSAAKVSEPVA